MLPIMFALISSNLVNLVGDWALIYGHLGLPAMGITGSGWSTCFARIYMAGVLVVTLFWVESKRSLPRWTSAIRIDLRRVWALLKLGAPAATQILCEIGAFSAATAVVAKLGPIPLSGHEIALNCAALAFMVPLGISSAAAVRVGQQLGRKDTAGARRAGWSAIILGVGFMGCSGLLFVSIPTWIARLFSPDPMVIRTGAAAAAGGGRIPVVRRLADGRDRGPARHRRHQDAHAGQLHRLLADRTPRGLCLVFQIRMGCSRGVDRVVRRPDDYRLSSAAGMAPEKTARVSRLWESAATEKPGVSS